MFPRPFPVKASSGAAAGFFFIIFFPCKVSVPSAHVIAHPRHTANPELENDREVIPVLISGE